MWPKLELGLVSKFISFTVGGKVHLPSSQQLNTTICLLNSKTPTTICSNYMLLNCITPLMSAWVNTALPLSATAHCSLARWHRRCFRVFVFGIMRLFFFLLSSPPFPSLYACQAISDATPAPLTHIPHKHMYKHCPLCYTWSLIHWNLRWYSASMNCCY